MSSETSNGLILVEPYASWVDLGVKTMIVRPDKLEINGEEFVLLGSRAYGKIKLKTVDMLSPDEFLNYIDLHRISETERFDRGVKEKAWKTGPLYIYEFDYEPFENPREYESLRTEKAIAEGVVLKSDIILKPKGPWGDGFKECIAWVKRNKPGIDNPRAYCGAIHQKQTQAKKAIEEELRTLYADDFEGVQQQWSAVLDQLRMGSDGDSNANIKKDDPPAPDPDPTPDPAPVTPAEPAPDVSSAPCPCEGLPKASIVDTPSAVVVNITEAVDGSPVDYSYRFNKPAFSIESVRGMKFLERFNSDA